jgi:hypothetical protein
MNMDNDPRVFGSGDVTVCAGQDGLRLYAGQAEIGYVRRMEVLYEGGRPAVSVTFATSHDPEVSRAIEEAMRVLKGLPWVRVTQ